jgi:thiamine biosynthesis lipoprotein
LRPEWYLQVVKTLLSILLLCLPLTATAEWYGDSREMMGTEVTVELWSEDEALATQLLSEAMAAMQQVDLMMNPMNAASELSRVNQQAFAAPVPVAAELYQVVERALYFSRLSEGAFDISFASVGKYYNYRSGQAPVDAELDEKKKHINYRAIHLDPHSRSIAFDTAGLQIDLGGIAKGFAVDRAIEVLARAGIKAGFASAGGDSRILGDHVDRPRLVGIRHPRKKEEFAVMIPLSNTAISTSGDYERFFIRDGVRFHHILDPQTGRSSDAVQSASVLAARAIDSDALSTTTFVLGVEKGLALINSLPGIDAIIIDSGGKLHYSANLLRQADAP